MILNWFNKRKMRKKLEGCNYDMVATSIKKKFSGGAIPNDLAELFDSFTSNPCFDNAYKLLVAYTDFINYFILAKSPILQRMSSFEEE